MLVQNPPGNFAFVKGISPYSAGAVASNGYEIDHVRFERALPLKRGFEAVDAYLKRVGRPRQALCAMELRSPKPFTFQGFADFNASYVKILQSWDILRDGLNPVARTNVAPEVEPPSEPSLYGFSITVPAAANTRRTFIVAGAGELPEGTLDPHDVVRRGETSPSALAEKARFVMGLMSGRIKELGGTWNDVTASSIYSVHEIHSFLAKDVLKPMSPAHRNGVTWHYARPPIVSIEYEMDVRACRRESLIPA